MGDSKTSEVKFEGWGCFDKDSVEGKMRWFEYEPKEFADDDVEMKVLYCGICGSDIHTASSGWGDMSSMYPQIVGHEIVGEVIRVGKDVKHLKVGDIGGVGAQCDSCLECERCQAHEENYCLQGQIGTYAGKFKRTSAGSKSYGGYSNYWRGPAHFTVPIPKGIDPAIAAPMLCGGTTVYSPLRQYGAGKTAKNVGVVGLGGLGHFAVLFAKAMGAEVTVITHSERKVEDAKALGASKVIVTHDDTKAAIKGHEASLELIVCASNDPKMPLREYLQLLKPHGTFCLVGAAEADGMPKFHAFDIIMRNIHVAGSAIGSPQVIGEMLEWAATADLKPWIQKYSMDKANDAIRDMNDSKARYRFVLVNEKNGGKMDPVGAKL